jgi:hypothetical protein
MCEYKQGHVSLTFPFLARPTSRFLFSSVISCTFPRSEGSAWNNVTIRSDYRCEEGEAVITFVGRVQYGCYCIKPSADCPVWGWNIQETLRQTTSSYRSVPTLTSQITEPKSANDIGTNTLTVSLQWGTYRRKLSLVRWFRISGLKNCTE